jgi:hypothetical protein
MVTGSLEICLVSVADRGTRRSPKALLGGFDLDGRFNGLRVSVDRRDPHHRHPRPH